MIQFYEIYKDNQKVQALLAQLSWTNNLLILRGTKTIEEKEFYIRLCIKKGALLRVKEIYTLTAPILLTYTLYSYREQIKKHSLKCISLVYSGIIVYII